MAPEAISEHLISKKFPGGASPQTPLVFCPCFLQMHTYTLDINVTPLQKILATGLVAISDLTISLILPVLGDKPKKIQLRSPGRFSPGGVHRVGMSHETTSYFSFLLPSLFLLHL